MRTFQRVIGVSGLSNLGVVAGGKVYRSAQPDYIVGNAAMRCSGALSLSIKSILNLREDSDEEILMRLGFQYFQLRLNVLSDVTVEDFDLIVQTLSNPDNQPILVHCQSGADRTGVACAAYRMAIDGWSFAEVWEELECYGGGIHNLLNIKLKHHLEEYAKIKGFK